MEAKLLLIPWMVSVLYASIPLFWFAIHPFAGSWRKMNRSPYLLLLPIWFVIISLLGWATWAWHAIQIYSSSWAWVPAALFLATACKTYAGIRSDFGTHQLTGEAELRPKEHTQDLVTGGMHARMRHPIYIAHLLGLAGWAIGSGLLVVYVLLALSLCVTFPWMVVMEERELEQRFGEQYRAYKQTVPLFSLPLFSGPERKRPA